MREKKTRRKKNGANTSVVSCVSVIDLSLEADIETECTLVRCAVCTHESATRTTASFCFYFVFGFYLVPIARDRAFERLDIAEGEQNITIK